MTINSNRLRAGKLVAIAAVASSLVSQAASAAGPGTTGWVVASGVPTAVTASIQGAFSIIVRVGSADYWGATADGPPCDVMNVNTEMIRLWQSLAQSALLSGREVVLSYETCGGYNYIHELGLH